MSASSGGNGKGATWSYMVFDLCLPAHGAPGYWMLGGAMVGKEDEIGAILNRWGADGWELVTGTGAGRAVQLILKKGV